MQRIAKFEKVSFEQFKEGYLDAIGQDSDEVIRSIYDALKLPKRATKGSAGYDFYAPRAITLKPGETAKIPTGIRAKMEENWVLQCYPRSGLGFKFRLQLNNTVGIIDSDYYNSDNEGHIFIKVTNDSKRPWKKYLMYFAEKDSLRVFCCNMVLLLMMKLQEYEMADLEVQQRMNRRVLCGSEVKIKKII